MKKTKEKNNKKGLEQAKIMEVNVSVTSMSEVLTAVKQKISDSSKFYIVTPNPELVLMAQKNSELKEALNSADYAIPDGVGLKLAIPSLNIIKGRDLFMELIKLANENSWKVFFLGGMDNEAALAKLKIVQALMQSNSLKIGNCKLKIETAGGPEVTTNLSKDIVDRINKFSPDLLFVAFGNPKQEIWIRKNLSKLNIGGAMAIGGTFRYIAGLSKLPPDWLASLGLEWAWRLITEPFRFKRIWNAVIVFTWKIFLFKTNTKGTLRHKV